MELATFDKSELERFLSQNYNYAFAKKIIPNIKPEENGTLESHTRVGITQGIIMFLQRRSKTSLFDQDPNTFDSLLTDFYNDHTINATTKACVWQMPYLQNRQSYVHEICSMYKNFTYNESAKLFLNSRS